MKGSITKYKDGHRVFISSGFDPETGKRLRITKYIKGSKSEARQWLTKTQNELDTGRIIKKGKKTVADFITGWWPMKVHSVSPTTARGYRSLIDNYVLPQIGSYPIQHVKKERIETLLHRLIKSGRVGQASHCYVLMKLIFNTAIKQEEMAVNPMNQIEKPKAFRKEMSVLSPTDWQIVRNRLAERDSWALIPFTLLITTGIRRSELTGLRWGDFDEIQNTLHIQRAYHVVANGKGIVTDPKTARSRRAVALDPNTSSALTAHKQVCAQTATMAKTPITPTDYIFARPDGEPWRPDTYSRLWSRLMKELKHELSATPRLHDLRHTSASLLLAAGADPKLISSRLGHSSVAFTMDTYAHLMPEANSDAAEKLANILNNAPKVAHKLAHRPADFELSAV